MQVIPASCADRKCKYYQGYALIKGIPVNVCTAFPDGIPDAIAYGDNKHLKSILGDNGIVYQRNKIKVATK
jgi:hypothetical protein